MKNFIHIIIAIITFSFSYHFSGESSLNSYNYESNLEPTFVSGFKDTGIPLLLDERDSYSTMEDAVSSHCIGY